MVSVKRMAEKYRSVGNIGYVMGVVLIILGISAIIYSFTQIETSVKLGIMEMLRGLFWAGILCFGLGMTCMYIGYYCHDKAKDFLSQLKEP